MSPAEEIAYLRERLDLHEAAWDSVIESLTRDIERPAGQLQIGAGWGPGPTQGIRHAIDRVRTWRPSGGPIRWSTL